MTEQTRADPSPASRWLAADVLAGRTPIGWLVALAVVALTLGAVSRAYLAPPSLPLDVVLLDWAPIAAAPVAIAYHLDGLSLFFAGLAVVITLVSLAVWRSVDDRAESVDVALSVLGLAALLLVVLGGDLIILYVSWEALGFIGYLGQRGDRSGPGLTSYAVGHVTGYALLAAVLIAGRSSGGVFSLGSLPSDNWGGGIAALMVVAALGRLVHASAEPAAQRTPLQEIRRALLTLSSAYLLLRVLGPGMGSLAPDWAVALSLAGGLLLVAGSLHLRGVDALSLSRRWVWIDAGLLLVAVGIGGPLAFGACLLLVLSQALSRLPAAVASVVVAEDPSGARAPSPLGTGLAFGSLAGLPPLPGFVARWLLIEAAWQQGLWLLILLITVVAAFATRAGVAALTSRGLARAPGRPGEPAFASRDARGDGSWRTRPAGSVQWLLAALPVLVASLVPALVVCLVEPALATSFADQVGSTVAAIEAGPTWPSLLLALLGPGVGFALHAALAPGDGVPSRRGRIPERQRAWAGASAAASAASRAADAWVKVVGLGGRLEKGIVWLEDGPYAAAVVVLAVVVLVVLAI